MPWPSIGDVQSLVRGPETVPVSRALAAAIARFERETGWRPFWSDAIRVEVLAYVPAMREFASPAREIVSVEGLTAEQYAPAFAITGGAVLGLRTSSTAVLTVTLRGGLVAEVPDDVFEAVAGEAARLAQADPRVDGLDVSIAQAVATRRAAPTTFERAVAAWRRVRV